MRKQITAELCGLAALVLLVLAFIALFGAYNPSWDAVTHRTWAMWATGLAVWAVVCIILFLQGDPE